MALSVLGKRQTPPPPSFLQLVELECSPNWFQSEIPQIKEALKSNNRMELFKQRTDDFRTPLMIAADAGRYDIVLILLDAGAPVDGSRDSILYRTPLHRAASKGHAAIASLLLRRGADPKAEVWRNVRPLDLAVDRGDRDTIALLRQALASP